MTGWNRNQNRNQGFWAGIKMESVDFLLESESEPESELEFSWNRNRNRNQDVPGIVHH